MLHKLIGAGGFQGVVSRQELIKIVVSIESHGYQGVDHRLHPGPPVRRTVGNRSGAVRAGVERSPVELLSQIVAAILFGTKPESGLVEVVNTASAGILQGWVLGHHVIAGAEETVVTYAQPDISNVVPLGKIQGFCSC